MKGIRRLSALVLSMTLLWSLLPAARAAGAVTPTPPEWMPEEYYLIFPGDEVYESENWDKVLELRADAASGATLPQAGKDWAEGSAGMRYEIALVRLKYAENAEGNAVKMAFYSACRAFSAAESAWYDQSNKERDTRYYELSLWKERCALLYSRTYSTQIGRLVDEALNYLGLTLDDFFDAPYMDRLTAEDRAFLEQEITDYHNRILINLDGNQILDSQNDNVAVKPEMKDGRVMIPIRLLAERLGADVVWDQEEQQVTMTRAGREVVMTVGATTATVDGSPVAMDVAPYILNGSTLIPARYLAEFFGQAVRWDNDARTVYVTEDKSVVGDSNLEAWALPMGAMRSYLDARQTAVQFGQYGRGRYTSGGTAAEELRGRLVSDWGIESREDLINTVLSMTEHGHNDSFLEAAAIVNGLSAGQYSKLLAQSGDVDRYMWPQTKALSEKWGDKGILAWDLFRMSNLVQWGYTAGYVTYAEALALVEPAVRKFQANFTSWEEAYENYLDGYNWWARNDMTGKELWKNYRGGLCRSMLDGNPELFDDSIFTQEIIPVPGLTAQQIWDETFPA